MNCWTLSWCSRLPHLQRQSQAAADGVSPQTGTKLLDRARTGNIGRGLIIVHRRLFSSVRCREKTQPRLVMGFWRCRRFVYPSLGQLLFAHGNVGAIGTHKHIGHNATARLGLSLLPELAARFHLPCHALDLPDVRVNAFQLPDRQPVRLLALKAAVYLCAIRELSMPSITRLFVCRNARSSDLCFERIERISCVTTRAGAR